ncbi:MAG: 50S ribosomal protein L35 [Patescibacteria group bacterium]
MATKTNKMFTKRLKVTKNGKVLARPGGKNHFNAKEKRRTQLANKRYRNFNISANDIGHYMPNA